jgi:hypothetical protein
MVFHGLTNHVRDNFTNQLPFAKEDNSTTLMVDKPSQPQIFNGIQWAIAFWDVEDQILKELFLNRINIFCKGLLY